MAPPACTLSFNVDNLAGELHDPAYKQAIKIPFVDDEFSIILDNRHVGISIVHEARPRLLSILQQTCQGLDAKQPTDLLT
jgi:hypothetical protein